MEKNTLLSRIGMPAEMVNKLPQVAGFTREIALLCERESYDAAAKVLYAGLAPDPDGRKILSAMLDAAVLAHAKYMRRGIPDGVYFDTMGAFSRFVEEYFLAHGEYGFETWSWAGRQTSLSLFRIGALEYEMCIEETGPELSVHIPLRADLSAPSVDASMAAARAFFSEFYPAFSAAPMTCTSWMLEPTLKELLPEDSRILAFAARFRLLARYEDADGLGFIFRKKGLPLEELPETTSLQRALKAHLLRGGRFGTARGMLFGNDFLQ